MLRHFGLEDTEMSTRRFAVIGGDLRNVKLAGILRDEGNEVFLYGFDKANFDTGFTECNSLEEAIDDSNIVIGPVPCSNDDETLNTPNHSKKIYIRDVFRTMNKNQIFIAGRISEKIHQLSNVYNIYSVDILEREEMAVLNAIPTAEGAIQIAMEEMPITLHDSKVLVLGFGRVGKTLARNLKGIGAKVYVEARKFSDIAWIKSYGYMPVYINEIGDYIGNMDIVFNTIPHPMLDSNLLEKLKSDCLVIDLASKPGGVDFERAKNIGIRVIWALSLPGKVAPITAAKFIKEAVYNVVEELGV
jgi:dipicolinate synthase subunit A